MPLSKPCYEEYANHAMRFYARNLAISMSNPNLKKIDIQNWVTCNDVMSNFREFDRELILDVYRNKCSIPDSVSAVANKYCVETGVVWQLLGRFAKEFAIKRGLI